ncbi:hypothetical protein fugu_000493 [Takifugu bimaculatus]|uniref:Protein transport protein Sec31A n=1 Tax=Takifugu bimaculatus TaxID=433685 RepID=A0A4Z2CHC2_9TELE|nr:hypothetical protein fugu_000493 [Takifugu bimaculatus]
MRLKEIQRTAHQAWSPAGHHPMYLALGTAAQQLDASFNTTAALEIFEMDFSQPSLDMQLKGSLKTPNRLHSIVWVNFGMGADGTGGRLIGGSENGILTVYNPDIIMSSGADAVVGQSDKHTGPIRALDFNPFQSNLLASGANDSEIYIWDLNNFSSPMTPGAKTQPVEDISVVSWNRQVQHILASANPSGKAVVWDLRKNEPIIKISDHSNRMHCSGMLWHPDVATQLVLASEDDRLPVIQMWDLRFATSPLKVLENHTRGILSISWSQADSELLLSSAKDNRILCWNPNTGEDRCLPPLQVPHPTVQDTIVPPLKKPPKWMRRPVGASFGFGGKLISFENPKVPPMQSPQPIPRQVFLSQVTTETEFLQRSKELQAALQSGSFNSYCQTKIQNARSDAEQDIWKFLLVNFEDEARVKFLKLLGFSKDDIEKKISKCLGKSFHPNGYGVDAKDLAEKMQLLTTEFVPLDQDTDGLISQALLVGNFEGAVDLCLNDGRYPEAILLSISGGEELLKKTQQKYLLKQKNSISMLISSVVTQNWRDIVQSCDLDNWKEALAALLTYAHPEDFACLCDILGGRLENEKTEKCCLQACLCYICSGNIERLVECWTSHRDSSSPLGLEDLVEKVMMLRKSIERLRNCEVAVQSPILAEKLTCYAGILAAEGSLTTAMTYLPENSDQPGIRMLRDRLFNAQTEAVQNRAGGSTSKTATAAQVPAPKAQVMSQYQPSAPVQQQPPVPSVFTPVSAANTGPGMRPSPFLPSATRPSMRPSYPQHPAPAPGFHPHQPFQPQLIATGRPAAFPPAGPSLPAANLSGPPLQPPSSTPGGLPSMPSPGVPPTTFMPPTSLPSSLMSPTSQTGAPLPLYPGSLQNQPGPPVASGSYAPPGSGYPQGGPGAPAVNPYQPPLVAPPPTGPQEGWNDPPTVRGGPRKKIPDNYTPPAPITAPVMGFPVEAPQPHDHAQVPPGAPQEPSMQLLQQLPTERVEQKEIPAEHMILKTTFDSLVQRCQLAARDPQTKRKLDDSAKRLGHLYDKLREQSLSQNILNGLHEISCCVASQNYQRGLEVHTQVVSSSNFSEISAFMPILKVVMTIANKLGV